MYMFSNLSNRAKGTVHGNVEPNDLENICHDQDFAVQFTVTKISPSSTKTMQKNLSYYRYSHIVLFTGHAVK